MSNTTTTQPKTTSRAMPAPQTFAWQSDAQIAAVESQGYAYINGDRFMVRQDDGRHLRVDGTFQ